MKLHLLLTAGLILAGFTVAVVVPLTVLPLHMDNMEWHPYVTGAGFVLLGSGLGRIYRRRRWVGRRVPCPSPDSLNPGFSI